MAEYDKDLAAFRKELDSLGGAMNKFRSDATGTLSGLVRDFNTTKESILATNAAAGDLTRDFAAIAGIRLDGLMGSIDGVTKVMFGASASANQYQGVVEALGKSIGSILGPEMQGLVGLVLGFVPRAFDTAMGTTKAFERDIIALGSTFGASFDTIAKSTLDYQKAVIDSNYYTSEGIDSVRRAAGTLAEYGVQLDETMRQISVGGVSLNLLKEGFLLSSATGMDSTTTFKLLAEASRTMGYSVENANRPIVALTNIARDTGLPISELASGTFRTAQEMSRLGLTVDGMAPIVKRFADTLGPAFKGLAIKEVDQLMSGLERQINTTNAAFIAMKGGLAGSGASAVGAQLAFEAAFKDPVDIMKSLATTLGGITGGRIIKFEEARANPALENQFKIQRDLLGQLTGITGAQQQRTLLNVLDSLQSGKQLTSDQQATLQDVLKDGQTKQAEQMNVQQQLSRVTVGLQTQANLLLGNMLNRLVPGQVTGELTRQGANILQGGADAIIKQAEALGARAEAMVGETVRKGLPGPGLAAGPTIGAGIAPFAPETLDILAGRPRAGLAPAPTPTGAEAAEQTTMTPGSAQNVHVTVTVRGDDQMGRMLAPMIRAQVDNALKGGIH